MTHPSDDAALLVSRLGARACVELFEAYGVELTEDPRGFTPSSERLFSGVIGFVGRGVRGTCLLAGTETPLEQSCPDGGRLRDWVGELANQLLGRLKTKLIARGHEVALTTPIVLSGIRLEPLPRARLEPVVFTTPGGSIVVWTEIEADGGFALATERPPPRSSEGDILLF